RHRFAQLRLLARPLPAGMGWHVRCFSFSSAPSRGSPEVGMYLSSTSGHTDFFDQLSSIAQLAIVAFLGGSMGGRLLGVRFRARGLPLLCGLLGLYAGSWLWSVGGWDGGPMVGGFGLLPAVAGALAVAGFVRLVELGLAGSSW